MTIGDARPAAAVSDLAAALLTLVPWVRVTRVLPTFLEVNMVGALTSYQSFFEKGSTLQARWPSVLLLQAADLAH